MAVAPERRQYVKLRIPARCRKCFMHPLSQVRAKIGVVFGVNPEHGNTGRATEFGCLLYELVRRAIVVRLAIDAPATTRFKRDDRANRGGIQAGECDGSPSA